MDNPIESEVASSSRASQARTDWVSPRSQADALALLCEVSAIYSKKGEYAQMLDSLVQSGSYRMVLEDEVPTSLPLEDYRASRQIQALFSKNTWIDLGYNPLLEGVKAFLKAESRCEETNKRLGSHRPSGRVSWVSHLACRKIMNVLGEVPDLASLDFRYGPGANTSTRMVEASVSGKLSATLACSTDMFAHAGNFLAEFPYLAEHNSVKSRTLLPLWSPDPEVTRMKVVVRVDHGKLVFVPKNAKTHRPIVVEPCLNGLAQLGIGTYLKHRIKVFAGQDLSDQDRNRKLARKGSEDGSLATIDLSSASDTISLSSVSELLPPDWFEFLSRYRTGSVVYDGVPYELEKFSSMGNGYTFELESLIFWALAFGSVSAVGGDVRNIGVFGDDIVIPSEATDLFFEVLDWYGFWVNPQKSFWQGPFRESCGSDWLNGLDVRPFFIRDEVCDRTLYILHNWAMRHCERDLAQCAHAWTWPHNRLYGPDGYGDGHLIGSHSLYSKRKYRRSGYEGGFFDTYSLKTKRHQERRLGDWLLPTYTVYRRSGKEGPTDPHIVRGSEGYVRTPIYTLTTTIFCG